MLRWTSSRSRDQTNSPRAISPRIAAMPRSIVGEVRAEMTPVAASMRAWASDPAMSASRQAAVEGDRGGEALDEIGHRLGEAARPAAVRLLAGFRQEIGRRAWLGHRSVPRTICREPPVWRAPGTMLACRVGPRCASIIRQNALPPALPDFRNLGTFLRILLAVNAGARWSWRWCARRTGCRRLWRVARGDRRRRAATFCSCSAVLWALAPWLSRQPYRIGVARHCRR